MSEVTIVASAPGKLVLSGEYAVLGGAPAIVMAVDRRARAGITLADPASSESPDGLPEWDIALPGFHSEPLKARNRGGRLAWAHKSGPDTSLLDTVLENVGLPAGTAGRIVIDTTRLHDERSGKKLGFGSSAAATVAFTAALQALSQEAGDLFDTALCAHRAQQDGRGSGVDIAAAVAGGIAHYRLDDAPRSLRWPEALHARILWSGRPASTAARLKSLGGNDSGPAQRELCAAASAAADAWLDGAAESVLEGSRDFRRALKRFSDSQSLDVFCAGHGSLCDLSDDFASVVYKPCGAGGGDVGIALAMDVEALDAFTARAIETGFSRLTADRDERGAELEGAGP